MNSIFGSAFKVSTVCSGVCYGSKTLTDSQTTPFPINRTKCPTGKNSLAHITYTVLHTLDEICHTQIVLLGNLDHISEDSEWLLHGGGQPAMWISRLACSTWLRRRHQRQILTSAPITVIAIPLFACLQFNTIKKASRKMKSLYVTFHENVKMWK